MNKEYELRTGQALVISGPRGCGKTTLARKIAAQYGNYVEVKVGVFDSTFELSYALIHRPATLIVEGEPSFQQYEAIKRMITDRNTLITVKGHGDVSVPSPHLILISSRLPQDDQRFRSIKMDTRRGVLKAEGLWGLVVTLPGNRGQISLTIGESGDRVFWDKAQLGASIRRLQEIHEEVV